MFKKIVNTGLSFLMVLSVGYTQKVYVSAEGNTKDGILSGIKEVKVDTSQKNVVWITYQNDYKGKLTFLDNGIFRYNVDPNNEYSEYATPRSSAHKARIQQFPDSSNKYEHPNASVTTKEGMHSIKAGDVTVQFDKDAKMSVKVQDKVVMEESSPLSMGSTVVQTLKKNDNENYYGGGTQNGRFVHTGEIINIANESGWNDGQVSSPNPFYWSTRGYGVLRNTFSDGKYNFGNTNKDVTTASHNENEFDAYYFVSNGKDGASVSQDILREYFKVTGNPVLLPEYGFYEGHLNCYNRDAWVDGEAQGYRAWETTKADGTKIIESEAGGTGFEIKANQNAETLNGTAPTVSTENIPSGVTTPKQFSAQTVLDRYFDNDMPVGYFLPNDGYGCGYGQNGYKTTGGVKADGTSDEKRTAAIDANVANLKEFTKYANSKGVDTGLWTQSQLSPDSNSETPWHLLRDFRKEVKVGGISTLKTDVAWVGHGYSMQLDGVKTAYDIVTTEAKKRPNIISLDGWAGSQRFNSVWTGDQSGGNWEYIRFHIPTYIGQSLSGNPNIGSDMDGIHGGAPLIAARDYQWKTFTPQMLNMDGWGSYAKVPHAFADPYKSTSRMYLKLKAQLMPYIYTSAASAANLDTKNGDTGLPMVRAMFLEFPNDNYAYSKNMQYQFMFGDAFLVAPVYQNTNLNEETGADIRNNIYLPKGQVWVDYFTGKQYNGGTVINNFEAPLWKLPLFVKNGSIVPMYEENNTVKDIKRANRIVEFWPAGKTSYTVYEDDGKSISNKTINDEKYGVIDEISYGNHSELKYESVVEGNKATLTAHKVTNTGSYEGYSAERNTTFVVNVSELPKQLTAKNGNETLKNVEVVSKDEFDKKIPNNGEMIYFYDTKPTIKTYANEHETKIKEMVKDVTVSPKLYVKFAKTNTVENAQTLVIDGFKNDGNLPKDGINSSLQAPNNIKGTSTSDTITLSWDRVDQATSYDVEVDGVIYSMMNEPTYTHQGLSYLENHKYRVRSVNHDGYSNWSDEQIIKTLDDPYRNVPKGMSISYDQGQVPTAYAGKFADMIDGNDLSEYSSRDAYVFNGKSITLDMKKVYTINKLDYVFRGDGSNGTIQKFAIAYSNDGVNWSDYENGKEINLTPSSQWPLGDKNKLNTQNVNARYATVDLKQFKARYLKLKLNQTAGGYLQAYEIRPYHIDHEKGIIPGDFEDNGIINDNDEVWLNNHNPNAAGSRTGDKVYTDKAGIHDLNNNGIFDAYDMAVLMTQLRGGVKEKKNASGTLTVVPSKTTVNEGEEFVIDVYGSNLKNVYATDFELEFNQDSVSTVEGDFKVKTTAKTRNQKTYQYLHHKDLEKQRVYVALTNIGNQSSLNGDIKLASVTLKAKKQLDLNQLKATHGLVVGSSLNYINGLEVKKPNQPDESTGKRLEAHTDIVSAQAKSNGPVGDGNDIWASLDKNNTTYTNSNYGDSKYAHPQEYIFELKNKMPLAKVGVRPRTENHYSQLGAFKVFVRDEAKADWKPVSNKVTVNSTTADSEGYTFVDLSKDTNSKFVKIELEPASENGNCVATSEVAIFSAASEKPTKIEFAQKELDLYVGHLTPVKVNITPETAVNKLYKVESNNDQVRVIQSSDENGYYYSLLPLETNAIAEITATSLADENVKAKLTVTVSSDAFKDDLEKSIHDAKEVLKVEKLYKSESIQTLKVELEKAEKALTGNQVAIDEAEIGLLNAIAALEFKGSDESLADSTKLIDEKQLKVVSATNYADNDVKENIIDNNSDSIWHSSYASNADLPVDVVVDLGYIYNLEQVDYLPRQNSSNGHITHYRIEVSKDNVNFVPVVEGYLANNGYELNNKEEAKKIKFTPTEARYVKFIALNSIGDQGKSNDIYASIAELDFYGETDQEITGLAFDEQEITMLLNEEKQLDVIITPSHSTNKLIWTSDKKDIVKVDENGKITTLAEGEATITVQTVNKANISASMKVIVKPVDKNELVNVIKEVEAFKDTVKSKKIEEYLTDQIKNAKTVLNDSASTPEAIKEAIDLLKKANEMAVIAVHDLNQFEDFKQLDLTKFDPSGQEEFKKLLVEVGELSKDPITNFDVFHKKSIELKALKEKLVALDVTTLNNLIQVAEGIKLEKYVDDVAKLNFQNALKHAKEVAENPKTVKEIEEVKDLLKSTEEKLTLKATEATRNKLESLYAKFNALNKKEYSESQQSKIAEIIKHINGALNNKQLSEKEATSLLNEASKVYADITKAKPPVIQPEEPHHSNGNKVPGVPTGDTTNTTTLFFLLFMSAGAFMLKRKKN